MVEIHTSDRHGRVEGSRAAIIDKPSLRGSEKFALVCTAAAFAFAPLGATMNVVATVLMVAAAVSLLFGARTRGPQLIAMLACLLIILLLIVGLANTNVTSLDGGVLGIRKSGTVLIGFVIGLYWITGRLAAVRVIWWILVISCGISLVLHIGFPVIEAGLPRGADIYTSLFDGKVRLQGIFAGPFHASMAASFILLAALPGTELKLSTLARLAGVLVAAWTLVATEVRTGLVAVAVGLLLHLALSRKARTWVRMLALTPFAIMLAIIAFPAASSTSSGFAALQSLLTNPFDSRFTYRFHTWDQAIAMINSHPIMGWGPGSAGDTLEPFFPAGGHVTSHSMFLKYFVEGGVPMGAVFLLLFVLLAVLALRGTMRRVGTQAALVLFVFGLTGSSVEAVPVSFALAIVIGIAGKRAETPSAYLAS